MGANINEWNGARIANRLNTKVIFIYYKKSSGTCQTPVAKSSGACLTPVAKSSAVRV
jgi:hypothetical protein